MFKSLTHRSRSTAALAIAVGLVGVGALVSAGSARPGAAGRGVAGEAALATHALRAKAAGVTRAQLAAAAPAGRILGQFLGKSLLPVIASLSRNGKTLQIAIGFDMSCTPSGNNFNSDDFWVKVPIGKKGGVHETAPIRADQSLHGGTDTLSGQYDRKHNTFTGTWDLHLNYTVTNAQNVQSTDQCDSGAVKFKLTD